MNENKIQLQGKYFIKGTITLVTGLYIGGSNEGLNIGGADLTVVRDILTNEPYIPGSSLKGKMRCLYERALGKTLQPVVGKGEKNRLEQVCIHICTSQEEYNECPVCKIFGIGVGESNNILPEPGRLIVRDSFLDDNVARILAESPYTDMPLTELKTEVVIDRLTSKATPRQIERVPAGAEFNFEMVFNVYNDNDHNLLKEVFLAMYLLEHDYLGGQGSRGSGQIRFGKFKRENNGNVSNVNFSELEKGVVIDWKSIEEYRGAKSKESPILKNFTKEELSKLTVESICSKLNINIQKQKNQQQ